MTPDSSILEAVLAQGIKRMQAYGFVQFAVTCEKVKTASGEQFAPALVSIEPSGKTLLTFFADQASNQEGGSAKYVTVIKNGHDIDLTQPPPYEIKIDEDEFIRWKS